MTRIKVGVVDLFVVHATARAWRVLVLRRSRDTRCPGSWETVHGKIERGETPADAAVRELREETGLDAERLYSVTTNPFYLHRTDTVQVAVVLAAFVASPRVVLGAEHDASAWLAPGAAAKRFTWPREAEALAHIRRLLGARHLSAVEDVLRVR